jgi:hypothetical protein
MMDKGIDWLEPWDSLYTEPSSLEKELYSEVGEQHILYGKKVAAIGRRYDCDEFLFQVHDSEFSFAVVHLTYYKRREDNPKYPRTKVYKDLDDWINTCMKPEHSDHMLCEEE